jgi:hypothetical protein
MVSGSVLFLVIALTSGATGLVWSRLNSNRDRRNPLRDIPGPVYDSASPWTASHLGPVDVRVAPGTSNAPLEPLNHPISLSGRNVLDTIPKEEKDLHLDHIRIRTIE